MNRRAFLHLSASSVALPSALGGCGGAEDPKPLVESPPEAELVEATVSKGPWVTILGPGTVRLRFETFEDVAVPVVIHVDDTRSELVTTTSTTNVAWAWGYEDAPTEEDLPGEYTLHDIIIDGIPTGATLEWEVQVTGLPAGSCRPNPAPSDPITVCWIADTMYPKSESVAANALLMAPDLLLHGGDFQYSSSPTDTWTSMFANLAPLLRSTVFQVCIGNHEFDGDVETSQMYDRLFSGQGSSDERWHAFTYGPVHILMLDSESGDLTDPAGAQAAWADSALSAAVAEGLIPIIAFHRPTYSLSKHWRSDTTLRDTIHELAVRHGVQIVFSGHVHGYERFVVDGIHYVVDGGGGALTYDLEEAFEEVEELRPGESDLRQVAERTHGCVELIVDAGSVFVNRINEDGETTDSFSFPTG